MTANIIAIETATSSCSAALRVDGEIVERSQLGSNVHSQVLLAMVQELLGIAGISPQHLDAVAVGQGPGSFTGLRIGVGVGQGLAYGCDCPMLGVSSLAALALAAPGDGRVIAGIDARMSEVYWGEYSKQGQRINQLAPLKVSPPNSISSLLEHYADTKPELVGNAWSEYWQEIDESFKQSATLQKSIVYPSATQLLQLAEQQYNEKKWLAAIDFQPIYVRNDVAKKSSKPVI